MITIKDIAKLADVSIATVSKIINGRDQHISEATKARVQEILSKSGYISNSIARGLKTRKTFTLGFILPDITNPYYAEIARGVEDVSRERDYSVIVCNTDDDPIVEARSIELFKSKMVDGIVFTHVLKTTPLVAERNKYRNLMKDIPTVIVDRAVPMANTGEYGEIYVDVGEAIYTATKLLIKAGCRRIACISAVEEHDNARYYGYYQALREAGVEPEGGRVFLQDFSIAAGIEGMQAILGRDHLIDGLICGNDMIAIGALDVLHKRAIQVPGEVKVIGLDNIAFSNYTVPRLTTMQQPMYEMGREAANMLIDNINDGVPLSSKIFDYVLIERESFVCLPEVNVVLDA